MWLAGLFQGILRPKPGRGKRTHSTLPAFCSVPQLAMWVALLVSSVFDPHIILSAPSLMWLVLIASTTSFEASPSRCKERMKQYEEIFYDGGLGKSAES